MNRALGLRRPRGLPVGKLGAESPRVDEPAGVAAEIRVEITAGEFQQCHYRRRHPRRRAAPVRRQLVRQRASRPSAAEGLLAGADLDCGRHLHAAQAGLLVTKSATFCDTLEARRPGRPPELCRCCGLGVPGGPASSCRGELQRLPEIRSRAPRQPLCSTRSEKVRTAALPCGDPNSATSANVRRHPARKWHQSGTKQKKEGLTSLSDPSIHLWWALSDSNTRPTD
jgi:hypothetical protein